MISVINVIVSFIIMISSGKCRFSYCFFVSLLCGVIQTFHSFGISMFQKTSSALAGLCFLCVHKWHHGKWFGEEQACALTCDTLSIQVVSYVTLTRYRFLPLIHSSIFVDKDALGKMRLPTEYKTKNSVSMARKVERRYFAELTTYQD